MIRRVTFHLSALIALGFFSIVSAADETTSEDIAPQPLNAALREFADQSGLQVVYRTELATGIETRGTDSPESDDEALDQLLASTGLEFRFVNDRTVAIQTSVEEADYSNSGKHRPASTRLLMAQNRTSAPQSQRNQSQMTDDSDDRVTDEIVVVGSKRKFAPTDSSAATKMALDVLETPQSLTVVSSELLGIIGANNFNEAAAIAPGVMNEENSIALFIDTVARGFLVDWWNGNKIEGMPFQNGGGPVDFGVVERMDIVRGPASIIYGQSDYGATLNINLKKPEVDRAFSGEIGGSTDGSRRVLADVTGALNESDSLLGRLIVIDDQVRTSQDYSFSDTSTVAPGITWHISDETSVELSSFHSRRDMRRHYGFVAGQDALGNIFLPDVSDRAFVGANWGVSAASMDFVVAELTHHFSDDWSIVAKASDHHSQLTWREPFAIALADENGDAPFLDFWSNQDSYDTAADLTLLGDFDWLGGSHSLMLSGTFRTNESNYFSACCGDLGVINIYDPDPTGYDTTYTNLPDDPEDQWQDYTGTFSYDEAVNADEWSVSALLLLRPTDRITVMTGIGVVDFEKTNTFFTDTSVSHQTPASYKNDHTTFRAGLVYGVRENTNVYLSYSDGVSFKPAQTFSGASLEPETGEQWEVGAKLRVLDDNLTISAAAFRIDRMNVATNDPDFPNQPFSVPIDGQRHEGFEIEMIGEPIPGWNIIASYSNVDVEITEAPDPGMVGQQTANTPRDMVKLYTTYEFLDGRAGGFSVGGGVFYVSDREADNFGSLTLPSYTRIDLRLAYEGFENIGLALNAINITDEKIVSSTTGFLDGLDYQYLPSINFRVTFDY